MNNEEKRFAIKHPEGWLVVNVLELSEQFAWAEFYRRTGNEEIASWGKAPPDWIVARLEKGYSCVQVPEVEGTCADDDEMLEVGE